MRRHHLLLWVLVLPGCTAFSAVRSAEVVPGRRADLGLTLSSPPGDAAAWFWAYDCADYCDRSVRALDLSFTTGVVPEGADHAYEFGVGLSGFYPYAHGYVQLRRDPHRPLGVGARVAVGPVGWHEYALFLRRDVELQGARVLLSPTLFRHAGNSPSGMDPGSFTALAQGVGVELGSGRTKITPSLLLVHGWVDRRSLRERIRASASFVVLGVSVGIGDG